MDMKGMKNTGTCESSLVGPPGSTTNEEKFLTSYRIRSKVKRKWYDCRNIPFALVIVSLLQFIRYLLLLQIAFHICNIPPLPKMLRFEPRKRHQAHRFLTYMLVHEDWRHLTLNVVIQCILAILLELRQGHLRVIVLYLLGGITGALGASCAQPELVIGASAGVYALLLSNLADIVLNYYTIKYKFYRVSSVLTLIFWDVIYNIIHVYFKKEPLISWAAHCTGGIAGLLLGFVMYQSETEKSTVNRMMYWWSLTAYSILLVAFVILTVQIERCTPVDVMHSKYIYFC